MGLKYYLGSESDFAKLGRGATWKNAATQILFSTSGAFSRISSVYCFGIRIADIKYYLVVAVFEN